MYVIFLGKGGGEGRRKNIVLHITLLNITISRISDTGSRVAYLAYDIPSIYFSEPVPHDRSCTCVDADDHTYRLFDTSGGHAIALDYELQAVQDFDRSNILHRTRSSNSNIARRPSPVRVRPVDNLHSA